jgi:hypothetical protein
MLKTILQQLLMLTDLAVAQELLRGAVSPAVSANESLLLQSCCEKQSLVLVKLLFLQSCVVAEPALSSVVGRSTSDKVCCCYIFLLVLQIS